MKSSIRLGKIAGINVGIHYSWFVVLAVFTWTLADGFLPSRYGGWAAPTYWVTGIVAALLLFVSVLIHELAHSLVAKARGFPVEGITLFLLGGVSNLRAESRGPRDEFIISVVGPLTSFALFGVLWVAHGVLSDTRSPAAAVLWYLWLINLVLGVFNLLPAFPLDGGRVLRAAVWATTGSMTRATRIAARGGQMVGIAFIALGLFEVFRGNLIGGLWYGFIGLFLHGTASTSRREAETQANLSGVRVRDAMDPNPETVGPDVSVADAVFGALLQQGNRALLVLDDGKLVGIMTLTDVKGVSQERWRDVTVGDTMTPAPLWSVHPDDELTKGLELLGQRSLNQAPVVDGDRLVGLVTRSGVIRYLHSRGELRI